VKRANRLVGLVAALACLSSGCVTVGPNYRPVTADVMTRWEQFEDPQLVATSPIVPLWWKDAFKDPVLDQLVDEALADNLTLRSAALRVLQARQQYLIVANLRLPQEQYLGASAAVTDPGESSGVSAAYGASFNLTWEIDAWGRIRRQVESASAVYDASLSSYDGVLVLVIGQVAQTYLLIRTTEQRLEAARQNLEYQNESVRISEAKLEAGDISSLDVEQGLTLVYTTQASIALLEQSLQQLKVSLAILLGQPPQDLSARLGPPGPVPAASPLVALGMPQDLIRRRPDIRVAERRAAAQCAQIGVAVSDLYPAFGLTGFIGPVVSTATEGQNFLNMFNLHNVAFTLGGFMRWNLFNWGRIRENVRLQDATFQQLIEDYRQVVLQAQGEVESALIAYFSSLQQLAALQQAADSAQRSVDVATEQYQDGLVDYNTVVSTLRALVGQQDQLASTQGTVAVNLVGVYLSLGGGWEVRRSDNPVDLIPEQTKEEMRERGKYWDDHLEDK
jgi:NodT family efflux transporter outer membrane factor (OMF) lipoprotein